jgi:5-methylcytosine-specific restriction endonuclease McrA
VLKACLTPRCPNYTEKGGRCPSCRVKHRVARAAEGLTGSRPDTPEIRRLRRRIRRRDGNRCTECGSREQLEVHHRNGNARDNAQSNLVTLCRDCHQQAELVLRLNELVEREGRRFSRGRPSDPGQ